jgi:Family of unknown function (DUF6165)
MPAQSPPQLRVPVSIGELIDKITILEIKAERITDPAKRRNVLAELEVLLDAKRGIGLDAAAVGPFASELKSINVALWDIEDAIRDAEARQDFGPRFIELARNVYQMNDRRARVKYQINTTFNSEFVEEKSYKGA